MDSYEEDILRLYNRIHQLDVLCEKEKTVLEIQPAAGDKADGGEAGNYREEIFSLKSRLEALTIENERLKENRSLDGAGEKLKEREEEISVSRS